MTPESEAPPVAASAAEARLTEQVVASFGATADPRLRAIVTSLVRHLHAFIGEVEPTFEEWSGAVDFLTRTGLISTGGRQEFVLLSDVLGASMLMDAINHRASEAVTPSTVLGPFHALAPRLDQGADISGGVAGTPLYVQARVLSEDGTPIEDAGVDVWQSDSEGFYDIQRGDLGGSNLRGEFRSDAQGFVRFRSITPTAYPIPNDGPVGQLLAAAGRHPWRPAHLHFMIAAPGHETLVTHIFVAGDPYLESDAVFGVKRELIDDFPVQAAGAAPDGRSLPEGWRRLDKDFRLKTKGRS